MIPNGPGDLFGGFKLVTAAVFVPLVGAEGTIPGKSHGKIYQMILELRWEFLGPSGVGRLG